ncbi:MAG: HEPN domain-containing protein [Blastocatellia bacterium]
MFYIASALLLGKGQRFSKHGAVISAFGLQFVKTGEVDARFHRYLIDAQDNRIIGDYSSTIILTNSQAAELIAQAQEFFSMAETVLGDSPPKLGSSE